MFLGISTPLISGAVYPENRSMVITGISAVDVPAESATPGGLDLSFGDFTIEMWVNRSNDSSGTLFQMHEVPNFATLNIALSVRGGGGGGPKMGGGHQIKKWVLDLKKIKK